MNHGYKYRGFIRASLIVIYAFERFNTPSQVRASTTAGRYYMPIFLYLLIYLVTFLVFTYYPGIASDLKKHLAANDISFVAAISTAFLSDWTAMSNRPIYLRRFLDGALQSIILVGGSVIVYLWLVDIEHTRVPNLMRLITMAGGTGFLIGFIVPN